MRKRLGIAEDCLLDSLESRPHAIGVCAIGLEKDGVCDDAVANIPTEQ